MRFVLNRLFIFIFVFAVVGILACTNSKSSDTDREVLADAYEVVEQEAIPDRLQQLNDLGWGAALLTFGEVEESDAEPGIYSIGFPPDPYYPENDYEIWEFSYDPDLLIPVNGAAYLTAVLLFCDSVENQSPECQIYATGVKNMIDQVRTDTANDSETEVPIGSDIGTLDSAFEELFWIAADAASISRQTPFPEARDELASILWQEAGKDYDTLQAEGIDAATTMPFCITYLGVSVRMYTVLEYSPSIQKSSVLFNNAIDSLRMFNEDVDRHRSGDIAGRLDEEFCAENGQEILDLSLSE
jgi:hypothetical protein